MKVQARSLGIRHSQQRTVNSKSCLNDEEQKKIRSQKIQAWPISPHKETGPKKQRKYQIYPKAKQSKTTYCLLQHFDGVRFLGPFLPASVDNGCSPTKFKKKKRKE